MASLQHYLATVSAGTLYVQQFTGATLSAPLAGGVLTVEMATDYPWAGSVELRSRAPRRRPAGWRCACRPGLRYRKFAATKTSSRRTPNAIPYFQWDNRAGRPMQVWIPVANT